MTKQKIVWACGECGHKQSKWTGSCSVCQKWNTFSEEVAFKESTKRFESLSSVASQPMPIHEIKSENFQRILTQLPEFDRMMGGGIVSGSLTLVAGDPGIGKSTLLLQIAAALAVQGLTVLYVCGEESAEQTSLRARRLNIVSDKLFLLSETLFSHIKAHVDRLKPDILIVDSVQILYKAEIPSAPGSVTQVREIAMECLHLSKGMGISTFLIGHVTKSGEIAGPRVLEHMVDTVLEFEGDRQHGYRFLRVIKNRFGPTDEITLYQMAATGLKEVNNPSEIFLKERLKESPGSVIIPTIEGSRAILVEVQALVAATSFATCTRKSAGLDQNRLALLVAVLEKRVGFQLHNSDLFVSVAGGMKIIEPAIDLGILLAIASSFSNKPIDAETVVLGEVGLGGEIRSVTRIESRLKEALHLGFKECILPKRNMQGISSEISSRIHLHGVDFVEEAIHALIH